MYDATSQREALLDDHHASVFSSRRCGRRSGSWGCSIVLHQSRRTLDSAGDIIRPQTMIEGEINQIPDFERDRFIPVSRPLLRIDKGQLMKWVHQHAGTQGDSSVKGAYGFRTVGGNGVDQSSCAKTISVSRTAHGGSGKVSQWLAFQMVLVVMVMYSELSEGALPRRCTLSYTDRRVCPHGKRTHRCRRYLVQTDCPETAEGRQKSHGSGSAGS